MADSNDIIEKYNNILNTYNQETDQYIDDLLGMARGDKDAAIAILTRDHEQALGTDDQARAKFLETVSDKLEERIGRIPYDYQVGVTRTKEDKARATDLITRNKTQALARLAEDEQVWKQQYAIDKKDAQVSQQEELSARGILTGTRNGAQGLAGQEVNKLDKQLTDVLSAYDRALGRNRQDINQQAEDNLFDINRGATRQLEDLKTDSRRGAQEAQDTFSDGKTQAERAFERQRKELERQRTIGKLNNMTYSLG